MMTVNELTRQDRNQVATHIDTYPLGEFPLKKRYEKSCYYAKRLGLEIEPFEKWFLRDREAMRCRVKSGMSIIPDLYWRQLYSRARVGAKKRDLPFELLLVEFYRLVNQSDDKCAVSKKQFTLDLVRGSLRRPYAPSIDRIDCSKGYTKENVRLVCSAVNVALSDWGADVFLELANAAVRT